MTATVDTAATAPVTGVERVDVLDVMRGIAVLGILLVNVDSFIGYGFDLPGAAAARGSRFNEPAEFLVEFASLRRSDAWRSRAT